MIRISIVRAATKLSFVLVAFVWAACGAIMIAIEATHVVISVISLSGFPHLYHLVWLWSGIFPDSFFRFPSSSWILQSPQLQCAGSSAGRWIHPLKKIKEFVLVWWMVFGTKLCGESSPKKLSIEIWEFCCVEIWWQPDFLIGCPSSVEATVRLRSRHFCRCPTWRCQWWQVNLPETQKNCRAENGQSTLQTASQVQMVVIILQETRNTYPTFHGKFGKSTQNRLLRGYVMLPRRVVVKFHRHPTVAGSEIR